VQNRSPASSPTWRIRVRDKAKTGQSLAAAWTGALALASGLDRIITIDVHSSDDQRLFPIPLISLSPAAVFAAALHQYQLAGATIIAPDKGAIARCEAVRKAAGLAPAPIPWFEKQRKETEIQHTRFIGEVGLQAVLVVTFWTPARPWCPRAKDSFVPAWRTSRSW
jgi:ribose-phosphate pyrophosphokinase